MHTELFMLVLAAWAIASGIALGYVGGYLRGYARLPLVPRWRRAAAKQAKAAQQQLEQQAEAKTARIVETARDKAEKHIKQQYPHLTSEQRKVAIDEILEHGRVLRATILS